MLIRKEIALGQWHSWHQKHFPGRARKAPWVRIAGIITQLKKRSKDRWFAQLPWETSITRLWIETFACWRLESRQQNGLALTRIYIVAKNAYRLDSIGSVSGFSSGVGVCWWCVGWVAGVCWQIGVFCYGEARQLQQTNSPLNVNNSLHLHAFPAAQNNRVNWWLTLKGPTDWLIVSSQHRRRFLVLEFTHGCPL